LLFFVALATTVWNPQTAREVPQFFAGRNVSVGGVVVSYDQFIVVIVAVLVVLGLRLFLYQTRPGIAMRVIVDDRELASMVGAVKCSPRISRMRSIGNEFTRYGIRTNSAQPTSVNTVVVQ